MYDGIKQIDATRALLSVPSGRGTPHALPTMLALRRGSRRLDLIAQPARDQESVTYWPEGRRRGRAGGRQEYRHLFGLAQPCSCPSLPAVPLRIHARRLRCELRAGSLTFRRPCPTLVPDPRPAAVPVIRSTIHRPSWRPTSRPISRPATSACCSISSRPSPNGPRPTRSSTASQPFRDMPEVVIPALRANRRSTRPTDAQAMVILANAYWLTGRGPDAVEQLAVRAQGDRPDQPRRLASLGAHAGRPAQTRRPLARGHEAISRPTNSRAPRSPTTPRASRTTKHDPVALKLAIATYEGCSPNRGTPRSGWRLRNP